MAWNHEQPHGVAGRENIKLITNMSGTQERKEEEAMFQVRCFSQLFCCYDQNT